MFKSNRHTIINFNKGIFSKITIIIIITIIKVEDLMVEVEVMDAAQVEDVEDKTIDSRKLEIKVKIAKVRIVARITVINSKVASLNSSKIITKFKVVTNKKLKVSKILVLLQE